MVDWQITYKCNENCISCILPEERFGEEHPEDYTRALLKFQDDDIVSIGGGEPALHENFFELLEHARNENPGTEIFLVSNGTKFADRNFAEHLASLDLGKFRVGISLYGHEPELHDEITRKEGSFTETVQGIQNLLEYGIRVEVRIIVNAKNYRYLPEIKDFVAEELPGIESLVFMNAKYTGKAFENREELFVRYSKVRTFIENAITGDEKIDLRLFHFPLCTVDRRLWKYVEGETKDSGGEEIGYSEACDGCEVKDRCPGIWKSYLKIGGDQEFEAIQNQKREG